MLQRYEANLRSRLEDVRVHGAPRALLSDCIDYARAYDAELAYTMFIVDDAIREITRRLCAIRFPHQLARALRPLPVGTNPPPLEKNDPRLKGYLERTGADA